MKKNTFYLFLLTLLCACKDFIEPSLTNKQISLLSPGPQLETTNYQQTFWWQKHEDALRYRLQLVSPSFNQIEKLILDTLLKTDQFVYTLDPGKYEWRVRAENGSSETQYTTRSFTIFPSSLKEQSVQLVAPTNLFYTANADIQYDWLKLYGATNYRLQIDKNSFVDENNLVANVVTDNLTFIKTLTAEGSYQYRVRAENATETSKWSAVRNFNYDASPPTKVNLTSPSNNQTVAKPVRLMWDVITDADKYELYVYKANGTTLFATTFPQLINTNSFTFNAGDVNEKIVWKVRAVDKAGNKGEFSEVFSFVIQ